MKNLAAPIIYLLRHCGVLRDRRGGPAVEMAFVLPFLIAMVLAVIETGRLLWTVTVLQFAVEQAARCAVVDSAACGGTGTNTAQCNAAGWALGLGLGCGDFTLASCANGAGKEVSISYTFQSVALEILPGGKFFTVNLNAGSCYPV
ncbi:MAG TPA: TadE/TadG family type IV pilus assembly protein [Stellaceae bacterium]|nr:TadE/TadG family type IV pilus assembly protein [Stellaceae bacterium]